MTRVLAFGTYNVRKHPRVGIIIDGLRKNGVQVAEVNRPLELSTAQRVEVLKKPWKLFGFALGILRLWHGISADAKTWVREHGVPDAVLVGYLGHFDVLLARRLFRGVPIVLDHLIYAADTAKDRGAQGLKVRLLEKLDKWALESADLVLFDTREHQDMLPADFAGQSMVVPVGAPEAWYQAGVAQQEHPVENDVVFYGLYTPLQGTPIIAQAFSILHRNGCHFHATMIGAGQDYDEVRSLLAGVNEVEFVDWVEPEELPRVVARHAVSLGIFSTTPKGLRVVPNKVYQALAAGCAVVTSDTAPQRRELGEGAILVEPGNAEALAEALQDLLTDRKELQQARQRASEAGASFTDRRIAEELSAWIAEQR